MDIDRERGAKPSIHQTHPPAQQTPALSEYNPDSTSSFGMRDKDYFVVEFESNDPAHPINWSPARKCMQVIIALTASLMMPVNGTSITIAADAINKEFGVSDYATFTNSYWPVTSWTLGGAIAVVIGLPLLEDVGMYSGFVSTYAFFLLMLIPQAVAPNFATLIIVRFFTGGCVAVLANSVSSMIPDLWDTERARTLPVSIYIWLYVTGDSAGPAMFAGVMQYIGNWRWIFYIQLIVFGCLYPLYIFGLRETRPEVILRNRAKRIRKQTGRPVYEESELTQTPRLLRLKRSCLRPLYLLTTEPLNGTAALWSAFALGLVFLFTQSVEQVFTALYGWTEYECGYVQGAILIGEFVGWLAALYGQKFYFASAFRNTEFPGEPIPEARLYTSVLGSFGGIAGGMFVYAWTSYRQIHWIAPAIGLGMVGFGSQIVVYAAAEYVTDAYADSGYTGSALAAVAFLENIICGFVPLASSAMYTNLGFQWASTLIACLALLLSCAPVIFIWKGQYLRERSPFMRSGGKQASNQNGLMATDPTAANTAKNAAK